MSTYKETIQSNNTRLQLLIDVANDLPEAGSGGGTTEIETCSVRIICETSDIYGYVYTRVVDNSIGTFNSGWTANNPSSLDVTLNDVLVGSPVIVMTKILKGFLSVTVNGDATFEFAPSQTTAYSNVVIFAPTDNGAYSTVTIVDID